MMVDVYDPVKNVWVPGVINQVNKPSMTDINLKVGIVGYPPEM